MDTNVLLSTQLHNSEGHKMLKKCLKMSVSELVSLLINEIKAKNKAYNFIANKGLIAEFMREPK